MSLTMHLLADSDGGAGAALLGGGLLILIPILIGLAILAFVLMLWWKIFSKAGYSGAMSLLLLIPIANLIAICVLAFGDWPVHRELRALRSRAGAAAPAYPPHPPRQTYAQAGTPGPQPLVR